MDMKVLHSYNLTFYQIQRYHKHYVTWWKQNEQQRNKKDLKGNVILQEGYWKRRRARVQESPDWTGACNVEPIIHGSFACRLGQSMPHSNGSKSIDVNPPLTNLPSSITDIRMPKARQDRRFPSSQAPYGPRYPYAKEGLTDTKVKLPKAAKHMASEA
ncbi:hypothetical protein E8E12_011437 [Didymella heteroderae]|uniref:Uncharacterized protein n=1 Tax=Didymella heteroderae TaxID=1769908 RepID=A0A9P5C5W8_9PLEO|nr:hypothetical protein E8E12_011437 [Didymella heteroderae]